MKLKSLIRAARLCSVAIFCALATQPMMITIVHAAPAPKQSLPASCARGHELNHQGDYAVSASNSVKAIIQYQGAVEALEECKDRWPDHILISDQVWSDEENAHLRLLFIYMQANERNDAKVQFIEAMGNVVVPCLSTDHLIRYKAHLDLQSLIDMQYSFPELHYNYDALKNC